MDMVFPVLFISINGMVKHTTNHHGTTIINNCRDTGGTFWLRGTPIKTWTEGGGIYLKTTPALTGHPIKVMMPNHLFDCDLPNLRSFVKEAAMKLDLQLCLFATCYGATTGVGTYTSVSRNIEIEHEGTKDVNEQKVVSFVARFFHINNTFRDSTRRRFVVCTSCKISVCLPSFAPFDKLITNMNNDGSLVNWTEKERQDGRMARNELEVNLPLAVCHVKQICADGVSLDCTPENLKSVLGDMEWSRQHISVGS